MFEIGSNTQDYIIRTAGKAANPGADSPVARHEQTPVDDRGEDSQTYCIIRGGDIVEVPLDPTNYHPSDNEIPF